MKTFFRSRSSGILITRLVQLSCASFKPVCMLCSPAFFRTSVSGILSCLLILTAILNSISGNGQVSLHDAGILSRPHMHTRDFKLEVKLDSISLPDICTESSESHTLHSESKWLIHVTLCNNLPGEYYFACFRSNF